MCIVEKTGIKIAIQPYYVMSVPVYYKEIYQRDGIAHFYDYKHESSNLKDVTAVPDACVDIICSVEKDGISADMYGTVLEKKTIHQTVGKEYFGMRFMPGYLPGMFDVSMPEVTDSVVNLYDIIKDREAAKRLRECDTPAGWKREFLRQYYMYCQKKRCDVVRGSAGSLAEYIKSRLIETGGQLGVEELSDETYYSARYLNKVLRDDMGFTPKTFARIVKFQNAIQLINSNSDVNLTDIAEYAGYYDQSHFIKEFKRFAELAPGQYQRAVKQSGYMERICVIG